MLPQNRRVTGKEQYYTPSVTSNYCLDILDRHTIGSLYLEPAGGTGSFVKAITDRDRSVVSYDIEPKYEGIRETPDFLLESIDYLNGCVTITNPPFGRKNSLSVPFFNKCAEVSTHIGFLVPKSWRKWTVINRLDPRFHLIEDVQLDVDFIYDGVTSQNHNTGKLNTVFQVWEKRDTYRAKIKAENRGYVTKTTPHEADVSLTAFGRGVGTVKTDFPKVKNTTQMFLRINEPWVLGALQQLPYSRYCSNVAFIEALSIQELYQLLNDHRDAM